ncbi:alpha/beta fold hydrolase [Kitasatospora sp. NPDC056800]|uniref:alpha/beta fold hydrolase n=1 Tax=Kitasatospora sp. NPDC056800 TaxID=3345948 RepID=UPI0036B1F3BC
MPQITHEAAINLLRNFRSPPVIEEASGCSPHGPECTSDHLLPRHPGSAVRPPAPARRSNRSRGAAVTGRRPLSRASNEGLATDIRFVGIPDAGHFLSEEQPELLSRELIGFFKARANAAPTRQPVI